MVENEPPPGEVKRGADRRLGRICAIAVQAIRRRCYRFRSDCHHLVFPLYYVLYCIVS